MPRRRDLSSGWKTYEVYQQDASGKYSITPFSSALAISGEIPTPAITKMRIVQDHGWPEARTSMKDDRGRRLIVQKNSIIWLLKCKPSCWRLYFYVYENGNDKRIIYVHAVCKKKDDEDPQDAIVAERVAGDIRPGRSAITPFEFPSG